MSGEYLDIYDWRELATRRADEIKHRLEQIDRLYEQMDELTKDRDYWRDVSKQLIVIVSSNVYPPVVKVN